MHKEIEQLNKMIQEIVVNQVNIVEMIENKSLPWHPTLVPLMDYNDSIILMATRFYMHILVTRHVHEMIEMWVNIEDYISSKYADKVEAQLSELLSLCTGRSFKDLTDSIWQQQTD